MNVKGLKAMAIKEAKRAKVIKQCGDTPPGHDFQNPKVVELFGSGKSIEKTCTKCGLAKFYPYKE